MSTIDIQFTQSAYDRQVGGTLGTLVDGMERVAYSVAGNYYVNSAWHQSGSTLVVNYADGAFETYAGFVRANPAANQGSATANSYLFELPDGVAVNYAGKLNLDYTINGNSISLAPGAQGWLLNDAGYALQLLPTDPRYDPANGNTSLDMQGTLNLASSYALTGTLSQFAVKSEKFLLAETIAGNFQVTGNLLTDGQQQTHSTVTGRLTGYHASYVDGSHVDFSGMSAQLAPTDAVGAGLLGNRDFFTGNDIIHIDLPSSLRYIYQIAAGAGDDQLWVKGGGGNLAVDTGTGNDRITLLGDSHVVTADEGLDTVVMPGARADYQVTQPSTTGAVVEIADKLGAHDTLMGVERIEFSDTAIALDVDGNGGEAYRLYQAAFARTPDKAGLGFWINTLDKGASLLSVAQGFASSQEFRDVYGANPSNQDLVMKFYQNILHRAPEQAGLDFWVAVLDNKQGSVAGVLMQISESDENEVGLIGVIGKGFEYTPYH